MGSEGRARLGLAGLLAFTLFAFGQVLAEGGYPGPTLLGMLLSLGIVMGARRIGMGSPLTLFAAAAGLLWYLTMIFQAHHSFYGLPTPAAIAGLLRAVGRAIEHSELDFAPVPLRAGYVIMVVTGMWTATAIGELATFRWRRPLVASLPVVVLFSIIMVVGTQTAAPFMVAVFLALLLTFWGLESAHRLRAWGRWIPTFSGQVAAEPEAVTGPTARRMGAACVAAALVAPLFLPAIGDGLLAWRSGVGGDGQGGGGGGGRIDPLVSIAPRILNQSDEVLFEVTTSRSSYWRLVTLVEFDGEVWHPAGTPSVSLTDGNVPAGSAIPPGSTEVESLFRLTELRGDYLPVALHPRAIDPVLELFEDDVRVDPDTGDIGYAGGLNGQITYRASSQVPDLTYEDLASASVGDPGPEYVQNPKLSPEVTALRDRWTDGTTGTFGKLVAIQQNLRTNFTYSLEVDQIDDRQQATTDHLTRFLTETRTGYCQQFATAFALLARSLGYPTRISVGFLQGDRIASDNDTYVVRGTDAHAWPEVYFDRLGWVRFEPTPRSSDRLASAPAYTSPDDFDNGGPTAGFGDGPRGVPTNEPPLGESSVNELGPADGGPPLTLPPGVAGDRLPPEDPAWAKAFRRLFVVSLIALALFLLTVPLLKEGRIRRRYRKAGDSRAASAAAFAEFQAWAAELVTPMSPSESAAAYARRVIASRHLPHGPALRLAMLYEAAEYGRSAPTSEVAAEARRLARYLRSLLWSGASWWERALGLFAPRGLLGRGLKGYLGTG